VSKPEEASKLAWMTLQQLITKEGKGGSNSQVEVMWNALITHIDPQCLRKWRRKKKRRRMLTHSRLKGNVKDDKESDDDPYKDCCRGCRSNSSDRHQGITKHLALLEGHLFEEITMEMATAYLQLMTATTDQNKKVMEYTPPDLDQ
jgi:hypothetical protein